MFFLPCEGACIGRGDRLPNKTKLDPKRANVSGPKEDISMRISHSDSKEEYVGVTTNHALLMFMVLSMEGSKRQESLMCCIRFTLASTLRGLGSSLENVPTPMKNHKFWKVPGRKASTRIFN